jgi:hypothetical protein
MSHEPTAEEIKAWFAQATVTAQPNEEDLMDFYVEAPWPTWDDAEGRPGVLCAVMDTEMPVVFWELMPADAADAYKDGIAREALAQMSQVTRG